MMFVNARIENRNFPPGTVEPRSPGRRCAYNRRALGKMRLRQRVFLDRQNFRVIL